MEFSDDPNLTVTDICQRLSFGKSFIYQAIADGRLEHYCLGRGRRKKSGIRISERQLQKFKRENLGSGTWQGQQNPGVGIQRRDDLSTTTKTLGGVSAALGALLTPTQKPRRSTKH
ncbi:excisionase family DNA-binding protein [Endozoicomonas gorgoniicola]|uniref:Excisionase family DNA-binding protein n=1 Tax=Endozoicomonas gorgoniicola TaxID=1234144 RepID=A0ABT3N1N6_9GAMM|nr:excisionase family DNA-binding protein [Endozoicomonas gorgoniicola]MCW7555547.1 excisionase family DNA-binding protein [Endozoicomonas gorgoniicola]